MVRRGEKVTVEVNVVVEGEAVPGTLVTQDTSTIEIESDVQAIPEQLTVSVEGADIGTQFTAGTIRCPTASCWCPTPRCWSSTSFAAPTAEDLEAEGAGEVAEGGEEAAEGEEGAEEPAEGGGEGAPAAEDSE